MNAGAHNRSGDKPVESTATRGEGTDDDDSYDELDGRSLTASGTDPMQSQKLAATGGDSEEPDKYAKIRREKRLAMNRESARNRRKQKQFLIKSLEDQVEELRKANQQYQITIESLSSKNRTLENELTKSRIAIAQLSNASTTGTGITVPLQHQRFNSSLFPSQLQHHSTQQNVPISLEPQPFHLQQQHQLHQPHHHHHHHQQQQQQQQVQFSGSGSQHLFDSAFSSQAPTSVATAGGQTSRNVSSPTIHGASSYSFQTANSLQSSGTRARGLSADVTVSGNQQIPVNRLKSVSTMGSVSAPTVKSSTDVGDDLSRLLQAQRDHLSAQRGSTINASMYTPTPVGSPTFAPTWDASMDDSLLGTMNVGPTIAPWQGIQAIPTMRNIETDTAMRGNLTTMSQSENTNPLMSNRDIDDRQNRIALDSSFSRPSTFDAITRSNPNEVLSIPEASGIAGYTYQQQAMDDLIRQRNIEDFIRYRSGKDQEPQPMQQPPLQQLSHLQQQQFQHQQLHLQLQQQQLSQEQQQPQQVQPGPISLSQSEYDDKLKSDIG